MMSIMTIEESTPKETLAGKRILVVDDYESMRVLLTIFFGNKNKAEVTVAASGQEAWEILTQEGNQRPNLIITDWHMGPMEAPELIKKIREQPTLAGIPIIVMSGNEFAGTITQEERNNIAQGIGANVGLGKPFDSLSALKTLAENLLT